MIQQLIEELERLNRIGSTPVYKSSDEDQEWFNTHPLRLHTAWPTGWSDAIPAVVEWLRAKQEEKADG